MSYERERIRFKLEQLHAELKANLDAERGIRKPPVPAPTLDQLRHHYAHYGLGFQPKKDDASEALAHLSGRE